MSASLGEALVALERLEESLRRLRPPLPNFKDNQNDLIAPRSYLYPWVNRGLAEYLVNERPWEFNQSVPSVVKRAAFGIAFMLHGALLLVGQTVNAMNFEKLKAVENPFEHDPFDFVRPEMVPTTAQESLDHVAPLRVSAALLSEPVRVYRNVVKRHPNLRDGGIEEVLTDENLCSALAAFRNLVFHAIPSDGSDQDTIESQYTRWVSDRLSIDNPDPLGYLSRLLYTFYYRVGGVRPPPFIRQD